MFGAQVVVAIENSRNFERSERRAKRFALLHEAGMRLGGISDLAQLDQAYDIVLRIAEQSCHSQVVIRRFDPETKRLVREKTAREEGPIPFESIPLEDGLNGWVARQRQDLVIADADNLPPGVEPFERSNPADRAFVVAPILFGKGNYYGNLALSHPKPNHFAEADVKLILGLAQQLGITIHRLEEVGARQQADQRARESQAMGWIGQQTYEIAHRMGNDLGLVPFNAGKIRKLLTSVAGVDPKVGAYLDAIRDDAKKVIQLSKDLNQLLRSQDTEKPVWFPVHEVVREALGSLPQKWKTHRFEVKVPDSLRVCAVYNQIASALYNLIVNAREATPAGGTITVAADDLGREVKLSVSDDGPGLKPVARSRVFDLFYSTKKGSSGFGLWSVRSHVLRNGGRIELLDSPPGQGATFVIYLPHLEGEESGRA
jgi:signal transduction histidine kinase